MAAPTLLTHTEYKLIYCILYTAFYSPITWLDDAIKKTAPTIIFKCREKYSYTPAVILNRLLVYFDAILFLTI